MGSAPDEAGFYPKVICVDGVVTALAGCVDWVDIIAVECFFDRCVMVTSQIIHPIYDFTLNTINVMQKIVDYTGHH
jgi:hypothetical protein